MLQGLGYCYYRRDEFTNALVIPNKNFKLTELKLRMPTYAVCINRGNLNLSSCCVVASSKKNGTVGLPGRSSLYS